MTIQTADPDHYHQRARQIRARVPTILSQWGLSPMFNRWRLTQDPDSGMVVLFAVLNNEYIASHPATPSSAYFDPSLLHDMANDLHVQVVSSNSDGLRYAFVLDRGSLDQLPMPPDGLFLDGDRLLDGIVYEDEPAPRWMNPQTMPVQPIDVEITDDHSRVNRGVGAFLKIFDDIRVKGAVPSQLAAHGLSDAVVLDDEGFNEGVAEHEVNRQRSNRLRRLFRESGEK